MKNDNQELVISMDTDNQDILFINFELNETKKGDFKKSFKMPLSEYEYEEMNIPNVDYDAEFSLSSKQISDMFSQLNNFGSDIKIICCENDISLTTNGITGEMKVEIPIDDLSSYSIVEDEEVILTYSLSYINKMCITNKLSTDIDFSLSNDCPMRISYNLGDDSLMVFYIAPKMND
jgi:proliferating cell nuclear antigen PCNA